MNNMRQSVHNHPPAPFFSPLLIPIFTVHLLLREVAILILESFIIEGEQLAEDLWLDLLDKIVYGVSVDKVTFFGVMGVEVEIEREAVWFDEVVC